jgi:hypothetical protein
MRVMVLVKATLEGEAGLLPSTELLEAMTKFNDELINAGIMLAGEGLQHPLAVSALRSTAPTEPSMTGHSRRRRS